MPTRSNPREVAQALWAERFSDAKVVFLAGSVIRGEGTEHSDLDIVVVYDFVSAAWRESFFYQGWPIEILAHDPDTLRYFFYEMDAKSGVPSLPNMVLEGIEVPAASEFSANLKKLAREVFDAGPPVLSEADIQRHRYTITDLCDDLRSPRSKAEALATGTRLYESLADFYFRSQQRWSAKGKTIPRKLAEFDSIFAGRFVSAFDGLFAHGDTAAILTLSQEIVGPFGGFLFEGYKSEAPASWKMPSDDKAAKDVSDSAIQSIKQESDPYSIEARWSVQLHEENKGSVCESVLRSLPMWFGIEKAILDYIRDVESMPMLVAKQGDKISGFVALNRHTDHAIEIHVMGVLPEFHRQKIGHALIKGAVHYGRQIGAKYLTVKTLSPLRESPEYKKTRLFYAAVGFVPIEEFKTLWGEHNPALMMIRSI